MVLWNLNLRPSFILWCSARCSFLDCLKTANTKKFALKPSFLSRKYLQFGTRKLNIPVSSGVIYNHTQGSSQGFCLWEIFLATVASGLFTCSQHCKSSFQFLLLKMLYKYNWVSWVELNTEHEVVMIITPWMGHRIMHNAPVHTYRQK